MTVKKMKRNEKQGDIMAPWMKFGLINPVGKQTIKNVRVQMIVHHLFLFRLLIGVFLNIHMGRSSESRLQFYSSLSLKASFAFSKDQV